MPFDFGAPVSNMGQTSIAAAEGLARELSARYGAVAAPPPTNTSASPR